MKTQNVLTPQQEYVTNRPLCEGLVIRPRQVPLHEKNSGSFPVHSLNLQTSNTCQQRDNDLNKSKSKPVDLESDMQQMGILIVWN